jgi:hypothetical protein
MPFPDLPDLGHNSRPANVEAAYAIIRKTYQRISVIINQEDLDPVQLNHHASTLIHNTIPILEALECDEGSDIP